jgi:WD40 repeat protein
VEEGNKGIYSLDYNSTGTLLATGGADATIRIYDDKTNKVIQSYQPGLRDVVHHFNRVH